MDTSGDVAGDRDAVSDRGGGDGNRARVGTASQGSAEIARVAVDIDTPYFVFMVVDVDS